MTPSGFDFDNSYYENTKYFDEQEKETVLIFIEDDSDTAIWGACFDKNSKKYEFDFKTTDMFIFDDDIIATGCSRIAYLIKEGNINLGKNIIACLDSDYHELTKYQQTPYQDIYKSKYIYLTGVHSSENIQYYGENLNSIFSDSIACHETKINIKPSDIATKLSELLFAPLTKYLFLSSLTCGTDKKALSGYHKNIQKTLAFMSDLDSMYCNSLNSLYTSPRWVQGTKRLSDVSISLDKIIEDLNVKQNHIAYVNNLNSRKINEASIYLFMRGHDIANFFNTLLDAVQKKHIDEKVSRYHDILKEKNAKLKDKRKNEKERHLYSQHQIFSETKKHIKIPLSNVPFFCDSMNKITQDYSS
ncbi:DUF4435 domain-containing protein [Aeromonas hydrophila]|uniref:DUF4435 domain-containing protein n=1 Tax=Aeromonas hydrophila TaxID=644 RepID=UPI000ABC5694|nr:DUF4435 domain-containing protein [Aeromonas hydrophila]MDM5118708.1 DUF4435 domain-containing protein [Aeromonas hydrophila]PNO61464.1 hypothetical protein MC69_005285 [Aeromonas hydrophila]